jgi:hypothetical protein
LLFIPFCNGVKDGVALLLLCVARAALEHWININVDTP